MTIDTLRLTAEQAAAMIERREVTAAELHRAYLDAIAERDGELHAYLRTVEQPEGDGVPIALKDLITTRGVETTAASRILAGYVPVTDSTSDVVPKSYTIWSNWIFGVPAGFAASAGAFVSSPRATLTIVTTLKTAATKLCFMILRIYD